MGDAKDNELGKGGLEMKEDDMGEGLRRSRRVRKLPPLPQPQSEGEVIGAPSERKRKRGRGKEADDSMEEEVNIDDGDEVKVIKSVKVGGGSVAKLGEATPSSSSLMSSAVGMSGSEDDGSGSLELEQSVGEEEAHPCLFIENILEVIFKHVIGGPGSKKDVQSIRLVCKTWTDSATRVYRRNGPTTTFVEYEEVSMDPGRKSLTAFMDMMKLSKMIPVQKFSFEGSVFEHPNPKIFRDFLLICGPEVVSLNLAIRPFERVMLNLQNLPDLNLGKLKVLQLRTSGFHQSRTDNVVEIGQVYGTVKLIELLLTAAKKLRELDLSCRPPCCSAYRSGHIIVMEQLGPIIVKEISRTVKQLKLSMEMKESTFDSLAEVGLKLEKFQFSLSVPSLFERRTLYKFLQSQAATLKEFIFWDTGNLVDVECPNLPELVNLELANAVISIGGHSEFAKSFPKLHRLRIGEMDTDAVLQTLLSSVKRPAQSLKVLHLPSWLYISIAPLIKNIAQSFPRIAELSMSLQHMSKDTLLEIFKCLDNLESLSITLHELELFPTIESVHWPDSLFCGISEADCSRIRGLEDFGSVNLDDFQRLPSIFNLTKLRKLSVDNCCGSDAISFTDLAAHFVFLKLESLRELSFSTRSATLPATQFSVRYVDLLREMLLARGGVFVN